MKPVVSFVGYHNSGKTTLIVQVVQALKTRGVKAAVIKHSSHGFHLAADRDTEKLFAGGADLVYALSPETSICYRRYTEEPELEPILESLSNDVDVLITEGFKKQKYPKIEVLRREIKSEPMDAVNKIAYVADFELDSHLPGFRFEESAAIADFIINRWSL